MAFSIIANWNKPINQMRTFLCDTSDDIAELPTQDTISDDFPKGVPAGSRAICVETSSVWILSNAGEWMELSGSVGGSGGGSTGGISNLIDEISLNNMLEDVLGG